MGVTGLWSLLTPVARPIALETLAGRRLAIDSSIWLYQFQLAMRDKKTGEALVGAHILGFVRRIVKLLYHGIKPVFVFDGDAPALKKRTIAERKKRRTGAGRDLAKTAAKLLAAQLRGVALELASKKEQKKKNKQVAMDTGDEIAGDAVYHDELDRSPPAAIPKKTFTTKDQYSLPTIEGSLESRTAPQDPRIATEEELRNFIQDMKPEDFDIDSPFFSDLPVEVKYEIIGDLRIKSRQVNHSRVEYMKKSSATALDFSKAQIQNLLQRNTLTQKLFEVTDALGQGEEEGKKERVAGERNREYVLVKQDVKLGGGWVLGVRNPLVGSTEVIVIDSSEDDEEESSEDEFEQVEIPFPAKHTQQAHRRKSLAVEAIKSHYTPQPLPVPLDPFLDIPRAPIASSSSTSAVARGLFNTGDKEGEEEEDQELQKALWTSLRESQMVNDDTPIVSAVVMADESQRDRESRESSLEYHDEAVGGVPPPPQAQVIIPAPVASNFAPAITSADSDEDSDEFEAVAIPSSRPPLPRSPQQQPQSARPPRNVIVIESSPPPVPEIKMSLGEGFPTRPSMMDKYLDDNSDSEEQEDGEPVLDPVIILSRPAALPLRTNIGPRLEPIIIAEDEDNQVEPRRVEMEVDAAFEDVDEEENDELPALPESVKADQEEEKTIMPPQIMELDIPATEKIEQRLIDTVVAEEEHKESEQEEEKRVLLAQIADFARKMDAVDDEEVVDESGEEKADKSSVSQQALEEEESDFEWEASPTPPPRAGLSLFNPDDPEEDAEQEAQKLLIAQAEEQAEAENFQREQDQYADMLSQLRNRKIEEMRSEVRSDIAGLQAQSNAEKRNADGVTRQMASDIKDLLSLFGIPYVDAPQEAEAECAELFTRNLVDGIVTDDSDVFLFGGSRIYRNMFNQTKFVECYLASDLEKELGLDRDKLVQLAYLLGSDYVDGLPGIGPVRARELLAEFPGRQGLAEFKEWWSKVQSGKDTAEDNDSAFKRDFKRRLKNLFLEDNWPNPSIANAYYHPNVNTEDENFSWAGVDLDGLRSYLHDNLTWGVSKVDEMLLPLIKRQNERKNGTLKVQKSLGDYFDISAGIGPLPPRTQRTGYSSGRLQNVVESWRKSQKGPVAAASQEEEEEEEDELDDLPRPPPKKARKSRKKAAPVPTNIAISPPSHHAEREDSPPAPARLPAAAAVVAVGPKPVIAAKTAAAAPKPRAPRLLPAKPRKKSTHTSRKKADEALRRKLGDDSDDYEE